MRPPRLLLFALVVLFVKTGVVRADEPFFKKGDVIAIVGGEDMVALSEYGYLELLLTRALPDYHLRFRNLAWEGDTVFEQRRDLNFPTWEQALDQIGATVVLCQFGQMESLAGKEKLPEFIAAYEKLLTRCSGGGKRRVVLASETPLELGAAHSAGDTGNYSVATQQLAKRKGAEFLDLFKVREGHETDVLTRDGIHLNASGHWLAARHSITQLAFIGVAERIGPRTNVFAGDEDGGPPNPVLQANAGVGRASERGDLTPRRFEKLRQLIIAKNRLWFDYWRVQNWAFLAGDRTNQPSSRDHLDPTKRWFPEERERFLPLIEAKEREIDTLAQKLAKP